MIDLRTEQLGGTWVRQFGDHEQNGFQVSINNLSAHVTVPDLDLMFAVAREDLPSAWDKPIDTTKLHDELRAAIVRRMTPRVLQELFRELKLQRERAFWDGERTTQRKIREALGL